MDPIDYYHQQFPADLDFISRAGPYSTRGIISFFTLSPSTVLGSKQVKGCELQECRSGENKHLFLMCYFFLTILDQAIHFNLRSEHKFFDFIARYPKFKGFLVTSHNNMHPNSLLVFATVYIKYFSVFGATEDFRSISRIMLRNICDFLRNTYPAMTERLPTKNQREEAVSIMLNTIQSGIFDMGKGESVHQVEITKPFLIGKHPVTQRVWESVMGNNPSYFNVFIIFI